MNPIQLHLPNGQPTDVYFCQKCRVVGTERAAQACCVTPLCSDCGQPCEPFMLCHACRDKLEAARERERFEKATKLSEWDGPVFREGYGRDDGFFASIHDLLGGLDDDDGVPSYVWTCTSTKFVSVDVDDIMDRLVDQSPMNWDVVDLDGVPELTEALAKFCEANSHQVRWDPDYTKCVLLGQPEKEAV